jgi:hypothetical protein
LGRTNDGQNDHDTGVSSALLKPWSFRTAWRAVCDFSGDVDNVTKGDAPGPSFRGSPGDEPQGSRGPRAEGCPGIRLKLPTQVSDSLGIGKQSAHLDVTPAPDLRHLTADRISIVRCECHERTLQR